VSGELVIASGNAGKLKEFDQMLAPLGLKVRPQSDWQIPAAVEDAPTFLENALIKARQAVRHTGLPSLADDSGLVVPALGGRPGIHSARYAGENADAQANIKKLLNDLEGYEGAARNAWFYCVLVMMTSADDPAPLIATGQWFGRILKEPRGDRGFGYDPVFGVTSMTAYAQPFSAAELHASEKSSASHRGQAMRELVRKLHEQNVSAPG
jgi:XTP/dITP diphosphohydrolase